MKVIKEECFQTLLKLEIGVAFQIPALQAVMADQLSGDMVHHARNLGMFGERKHYDHGEDNRKQMEVSKHNLQWRWLIIGGNEYGQC